MEDIRGFSERGNWYKGNLHSHTTNSDGHLTPAESVRMFRDHGYSFLAFTDHDRYSDYRNDFDGDDFIIIPGYEASAVLYKDFGLKKRVKVHHVNALLGTSRMVREAREPLPEHLEILPQRVYFKEWNGAAVLRDMVGRMRGMGFIAMYNHPIWSRVSEYEFAGEAGIFALEIFNYDTENESGTGFDTTHWDVMLSAGRRVWGTATDDNHNEGIFDDSCGGWVTVRAPELTHDAIIENLLAGNFYSSAGPEIYDWRVRNGRAFVECSSVSRINFIAGGEVGDGITVMGSPFADELTGGEYKLKGRETYVRAECIDMYGRKAWTNPIFLK